MFHFSDSLDVDVLLLWLLGVVRGLRLELIGTIILQVCTSETRVLGFFRVGRVQTCVKAMVYYVYGAVVSWSSIIDSRERRKGMLSGRLCTAEFREGVIDSASPKKLSRPVGAEDL